MKPQDPQRVYDALGKLSIAFTRLEHPPVHTMADCRAIGEQLGAPFCKNLFLQNRQGTRFYLLLIGQDKALRTARISKMLGISRLSFGSAPALEALLGTAPGAISPLGLLYDTRHAVTLLVDEDFRQAARLSFHPCVNTASLALSAADFFNKFLPHTGHEPVFLTIEDVNA
ncbi:MAG: prolyl-tRNA synthetase associated domain-containing protein [Eubacteriales bacterium]|nr:prolyl-tRNA synthetase associated domain-containing protein [Eubacteriales bacterium]